MLQGEPIVHLSEPLAPKIVVGKGHFQVLRGELEWSGHQVKQISLVKFDDRACLLETFPVSGLHKLAFFIRIPWFKQDVGQHVSISISISDAEHNQANIELGEFDLIACRQADVAKIQSFVDEPMVAVCMASYAPPIDRIIRQIKSIQAQSYKNWVLIIADDASKASCWPEIQTLFASEQHRLCLYEHQENLGFYHNFERALAYVPDNVQLIALADQDDNWYRDKLAKLVERQLSTKAKLVYSDMRVVRDSGEVISDTYWQGRKNEYHDFDTVFLANTVTGAASLFERDLLETVLPFPDRVGDAFHDHWLACVALTKGKLSFIDEPLYDYIQYDDSVIGHCNFEPWSVTDRLKSILRFGLRLLKPTSAKAWVGQKIGGGIAIYRGECLRLQTMAETLKLREPQAAKNKTLNLMNGGWLSAVKLLGVHIKILFTKRTTDDAEFRLAMGFLAFQYLRARDK